MPADDRGVETGRSRQLDVCAKSRAVVTTRVLRGEPGISARKKGTCGELAGPIQIRHVSESGHGIPAKNKRINMDGLDGLGERQTTSAKRGAMKDGQLAFHSSFIIPRLSFLSPLPRPPEARRVARARAGTLPPPP